MVARLTGAMELLRTSVWISAFVIVASGSLLAETAPSSIAHEKIRAEQGPSP